MSTEELAVRMDAAFVKKEREHRFAAALWLLRRNPTLKRTLRAICSHVPSRDFRCPLKGDSTFPEEGLGFP